MARTGLKNVVIRVNRVVKGAPPGFNAPARGGMRWSGLRPENSENAGLLYLRGDRSFPALRDVLVKAGMALAVLLLGAGAYFLFSRIVLVKFRDTPLVEQDNFWIRNPAAYAQSLIGVDQIAMEKFELIAPVNATDRWSMRGVLRNNARFPIDEATIAVFVSECGDPARGCSLAGQDQQARIALGRLVPGEKKDFYQFVDMRAFGARSESFMPATDKWIMSFLVRRVRASPGALADIARATQKSN